VPKGQPDFMKRHAIFSSCCLFLLMEIAGHILWLLGVVPDNNTGGKILYQYVPQAWLVIAILLVARKFY
jgi:uncharacterized membrane protein YdjX (TVP38/TMEM64 family)